MSLFSRNKSAIVQSLVLKLVNTNCPRAELRDDDLRRDRRIHLVLVAVVAPIEGGRLVAEQAFTAVTKEFSNLGLSIVIDRPRGFHQAVVGFRIEGAMTFFRAEAKHLSPMGGGFFQLGFQLLDIVAPDEFPELASIRL